MPEYPHGHKCPKCSEEFSCSAHGCQNMDAIHCVACADKEDEKERRAEARKEEVRGTMSKKLSRADLEELAAWVWEQGGHAPEGIEFVSINEGTKDIFRRSAAIVAEKLGHTIAKDAVQPRRTKERLSMAEMKKMVATIERDGVRHEIFSFDDDLGAGLTACGLPVARGDVEGARPLTCPECKAKQGE